MRIFLLAAGLLILLIGCATPATTPASTPLPSPPTSEADDVTMVTEEPTPLTAVSPAATSQIFVPLLPGNGQPATTAAPTPEPPVAPPAETTEEPPAPTSPPVPISTPYVSFIPDYTPRPELGPSKMGIHVARPNSPAIMEFVRAAQPAVVKGVDDLGFLAEVKAISPHTVTIGRFSVDPQDYNGEPEAVAAALVARQLPQMVLHPAVDYWEGWNEPDPNLDRMDWYARFEAERVRQLAQYGLRAAVGGFSTGVPELDEFVLFVPAIEEAQRHGGILTLHEYAAPDLTFLYGDPLPGLPAYPDRGPLMFRYRWFYRDVLEPRGLVVPLVISEAGIDGIIGNRPGPDGLGWQDFQSFWVAQGWGPDGQTAYLNQLQWVDNEARQDPYVIGYTLFTAGGGSAWPSYELAPFLPRLAEYIVSQSP
ncbi:MAG: hypothetical protein KIS95_04115 [Anaerolineae bacterium]|uniref:hypothetical protein n=1 Tax=Promineifilum sp. TaxID=2664178 RepID=UPI002411B763|nr:hypothetical protein [Promineifilum sp.]MCO5181477.1 hypothetical protein [Promineifilum sp.]MCW5846391.1 hypothetical protein [Anaerolineae bacterium]